MLKELDVTSIIAVENEMITAIVNLTFVSQYKNFPYDDT